MVAPAIPIVVGAGAWAYRIYRVYRATRAVEAAAATARAAQAAQLARAAAAAKALAQAKAREDPCEECRNPCAHLACGAPGSAYRGGAHGCVGKADNKIGPSGSIHSHHTPADVYSPLPRPVGPAIQMRDVDHRLTSSYGSKVHGPSYQPQRAALARGQTMQALLMDAAEVRAIAAQTGDPTRYDDALRQMFLYANCLKQNGLMK